MSRWLTLIPLAALAALAIVFAGWSLRRDPEVKPDALVGQPIPETVLPMLEGGRASERTLDLKTAGVGRPMLVNVFASWCAPCRAEHPQLMALKRRGVKVVGVAYKDDPAKSQAFLAELGDPYDIILVDREGRAGLDLGISGVPETFAVNAKGKVVAKFAGPLTEQAEVERLVAALH